MERIALSIKQPWATLLVHGIKQIEIRRWSTKRTGLIHIHTGRQIDRSEVAWRLVPPALLEMTELRGGIIGTANLTGCRAYRTPEQFTQDQPLHRNLPEWFQPPVMYGFLFTDPRPIPFEEMKGNLYFFEIPSPT